MPKFGPFLPNIEESIKKILEQTNLTPNSTFNIQNFQERFYTTTAKSQQGNKFIIKIRIEDFPMTKKIFSWEMFFVQYFSKKNTKELYTANFITSSIFPPEWMIYEFIEGACAGTMCGLRENTSETFPTINIVKAVNQLQQITETNEIKEKIQEMPPKKCADLINEFKYYASSLNEIIPQNKIIKAIFALKNHKNILDQEKKVLAHGDFHPGNIIIQKNTVFIIDWAYIHLNNYLYDFTFLWLSFWNNKNLQKQLLAVLKEKYYKKKNFDILFKLNQIRLIPQMIEIMDNRLKSTTKKEKFIEAKKILINQFKQAIELN